MNAVALHGVSIALARRTFQISETCYQYSPVLNDENEEIANWLERLTSNKRSWGFGLCFLYLRNVQGYGWNHRLNQIIEWRGQPQTIRVDNGPEYVSEKLMAWAEKRGVRLEYIQSGKPQQNACIEHYNRTVRGEWLGQYIFESIAEAQDQATERLWTYNNERLNMGIGGMTPAMKLKAAA